MNRASKRALCVALGLAAALGIAAAAALHAPDEEGDAARAPAEADAGDDCLIDLRRPC